MDKHWSIQIFLTTFSQHGEFLGESNRYHWVTLPDNEYGTFQDAYEAAMNISLYEKRQGRTNTYRIVNAYDEKMYGVD